MLFTSLPLLAVLPLAAAQQAGSLEKEVHPKLPWSRCTADGCRQVNDSLVLDANMRWLHQVGGYRTCCDDLGWDPNVCRSSANCTDTCAVEGAQYSAYGVNATNDSISLRLKTNLDYASTVGSRLFLLDSASENSYYQMFTLRGNELAFDVDLSTVACGINSALRFVAMDADGGVSRFPATANTAGAAYGTGYCDARCSRDQRFVGGKANSDGWVPSETDPSSCAGKYGACCPEFAVWNSNAHSFSMSSHPCPQSDYHVCEGLLCNASARAPDEPSSGQCDPRGCSYNPFRMGNQGFYGQGKAVDTARKFTVVTRFEDARVSQFFVQDGKTIAVPPPTWVGLPRESGLTAETCAQVPAVFGERDSFAEGGGWRAHAVLLRRPMVLAMSISVDYDSNNRWLDSLYPPQDGAGQARGDCPVDEDAFTAVAQHPNAKVTWSNIRFGTVGSTVALNP
ncbi:family 7 glycosyl hydrolase [Lasiosphaeria ovina]|uniref:Glucanase n=1 Tax=Lasiosphaeria ovina TaxID=92902 RepID=A0AAE0JUY8_9PEZI|nr:family 7 glycosyl hydrolase [Lasiosphaeria ovina]